MIALNFVQIFVFPNASDWNGWGRQILEENLEESINAMALVTIGDKLKVRQKLIPHNYLETITDSQL